MRARARVDRPRVGRFCLFSSCFAPDSSEILGGASDSCVYLYNLERKQRTHRVDGHQDDVNSVCWLDESGQLFASGSDDYLIGLWDRRLMAADAAPHGGVPRGMVGALVGHTAGLTCVSARGDGRQLLVRRRASDATPCAAPTQRFAAARAVQRQRLRRQAVGRSPRRDGRAGGARVGTVVERVAAAARASRVDASRGAVARRARSTIVAACAARRRSASST